MFATDSKPDRETLEKVAQMYGISPYPFFNDEQLGEEISKASGTGIFETLRDLDGANYGSKQPSVYFQISRAIAALAELQNGLMDWERSGYKIGAGSILSSVAAMAEEAEDMSRHAEDYTYPSAEIVYA